MKRKVQKHNYLQQRRSSKKKQGHACTKLWVLLNSLFGRALLLFVSEILKELECLNRSLQSRTGTITGMLAAVDCVMKTLKEKRADERFHQIYVAATDMIAETGVEPIQRLHISGPPKRVTGNAEVFVPATTEDHYRVEDYKVLDAADVQLTERIPEGRQHILNQLEQVLLTGQIENIIS